MSTAEAFWMSVGASGRLVELSRDECLELLRAMSVGRIAYTGELRPGGRRRDLPHRPGR